jgi:PAS domain S-box-containing protein
MSKLKVLIVEAQGIDLSILTENLISLGYEVLASTTSGEEALDMARRERPNVAFVGTRLGGKMTRIETAMELSAVAGLAIVVLAKSFDKDLLGVAIKKSWGYLCAPFEQRDIVVQLEQTFHYCRRDKGRVEGEGEEYFRTLVEQIRDHAIFRTDTGGRPTTWNEGVRNVLGFEEREFINHDITTCIFTREDIEAGVPEHELREAAEKGRSSDDRWMRRKDGSRIWAAGMTYGLYRADGTLTGFSKVMRDLTEWKQIQERDRFLWTLENAIRPVVDAHEITQTAARLLGEHLGVNRCVYIDVGDDGNYTKTGNSVIAQYNFGGFNSECLRLMQSNQPFIVADTESDPHCFAVIDSFRQAAIRAVICVPLHKDGRLAAAMVVHTTQPRVWRQNEVELLETVAARCWESLERARVLRDIQELNNQLEQRVEDRTREVVAFQEKLRAMATQLNLAEQRERKRLAAELHDHLQQTLALGKMKVGQGKLRALDLNNMGDLLNEIDEVFSSALSYTRSLVADLFPPSLQSHGLRSGLKWLAGYMKQHQLDVKVMGAEGPHTLLPEDQVVLVLQSVRELLINVAKHARTGEASVSLKQQDAQLRIEVRDEGVGFDGKSDEHSTDASGLSTSFGLFSIRERMRALGGTLEILSTPGAGTTAVLLLPVGWHSSIHPAEAISYDALRPKPL